MKTLKLQALGEHTGVIFPKEMLDGLGVGTGDTLLVQETPDGYLLSPLAPEITEQVKLGRDAMTKFSDTFKRLA